jgi:putative phosphoesterase
LKALKNILLLSDTHGYIDDRILHFASLADEVWHAGDWGNVKIYDSLAAVKPVRGVYGNIDGHDLRSFIPLHQRFNCEGVDVWITHIGGYPGHYSIGVRKDLEARPPKLFICGHSHILKVMPDKKLGLMHMNPGAAGLSGFHIERTMLRFQCHAGKIENLELIKLGERKTLV